MLADITRVDIEAVITQLTAFYDIEAVFNPADVLIIAEDVNAIQEFEARLVARIMVSDREGDMANLPLYLDHYVDFIERRGEFRQRGTHGWQARYLLSF